MTSADLIRRLKAGGWIHERTRGSHHLFKHPVKTGIVVSKRVASDPAVR